MNEKLLHYLWQTMQFNLNELTDTTGEAIEIIAKGNYNANGGPDFTNAKIRHTGKLWVGNIELHVCTSDWKKHNHSSDKKYGNVILHVVWEHDVELGLNFPTLELKGRVSLSLMEKHRQLMGTCAFIPCEKMISAVDEIIVQSWKERLLVERLIEKSLLVQSFLAENKNSWEESFWWLLARNFGITANADAFEQIARSLSVTTLAKSKSNLLQIEALLMGQAGLLENSFNDDYANMLQKEYRYLQVMHKLKKPEMLLQFLRMRPANFPTIRLSQLAMLVHKSTHLFSKIKEANTVKEIEWLLDVKANDYWHYHYVFDEKTPYKQKLIGRQMRHGIIINTVLPILFAYGTINKEPAFKSKALQWLDEMQPEQNKITKGFSALGLENKSAFDSQALLQLYKKYCDKKRCLECAIGNGILKKA